MGGAGEGWGHLGDVLQRLVEQLHLCAQRLHLFCRWLLSTRGLLRNTTWLACNVHRALGVQSARCASCLAPPAHITPRTPVLHTVSWLGAAPCTPTRILVSYTPCPSVHGVLVCTVSSTKLPPCPGGCALGVTSEHALHPSRAHTHPHAPETPPQHSPSSAAAASAPPPPAPSPHLPPAAAPGPPSAPPAWPRRCPAPVGGRSAPPGHPLHPATPPGDPHLSPSAVFSSSASRALAASCSSSCASCCACCSRTAPARPSASRRWAPSCTQAAWAARPARDTSWLSSARSLRQGVDGDERGSPPRCPHLSPSSIPSSCSPRTSRWRLAAGRSVGGKPPPASRGSAGGRARC